ncbi:unnamed protein product [Closterium sp. NIES-54]
MILLCREPRLETRVKHIVVWYFLLRELQRRGQVRLDFVASEANTADLFTKALAPGDHHRFCVQLGLVEAALAARAARLGPACAPLKPPARNLVRPRQRGPSPSAARSLATSPQSRTCGPSPSAARSRTQLAAAHAACRHAQPVVASSPQPAQPVAARSLRPRALPVATCSLQLRAASRHTQPAAALRPLLLAAYCRLLPPAACLPACCLLPPACRLPAACLLPACCLLPAAACLLLAAPASCLCLLPPTWCLLPLVCCLLPTTCCLCLLLPVLLVALLALPSLRGAPPPLSPPPTPPQLLLTTTLVLRRSELLPLLVGSVALAGAAGVAGAVGVAVEVAVVQAAGEVEVVGVVVGVEAVELVVGAAEALGAVEGAAAAVGEEGVVVAVVVRTSSSPSSSSSSSSSVSARPPLPSSFLIGPRAGRQCTGFHTEQRCFARLSDAWRAKFPDATKFPNWADLLRRDVPIFDLDYEAILAAMYLLSVSAEGDCYLCVPPDPGITPGIAPTPLGACESAPLGTAPAQALHTFTLDSGASRCFFRDSTTVTPLLAPVPVSLADPSGGPVLARSSTVLLCPAVPFGELSGLHLPSFSTNLVSNAVLQDAGADTFTPGRQRVAICMCSQTGRHLATFTRAPGSSLYTLTTASRSALLFPQLHASAQVSASPPSLACAALHSLRRGAAARRSSLLLVPSHRAALRTLHLDRKGDVPDVLIPWIRATRLQLRERFLPNFPVLRLHSDRGGEFSLDLLAAFCAEHGIRQTFTLPASSQQNGVAERRIGLVMEVARTSMIHAVAPHFLWPFAVRYAAHQLNLWARVSLPETSPTLLWTGKVGDASRFRVRGARAFVRDTTAEKLSPRAIPCVFLGFVPDAPGWQFYDPASRPQGGLDILITVLRFRNLQHPYFNTILALKDPKDYFLSPAAACLC